MKRNLFLLLSVIWLASLSACAPGSTIEVSTDTASIQLSVPGPNPLVNQPDARGRVASAVSGLWHGIIMPVTLVLSFFYPDVQIYEVHNSGAEYNFGFFLGEAFMFGLLALFLRMRRSG